MKKTTFAVLFSLLAVIPALSRAATAQDYRDMGQALYQKGLYAKAVDYFRQAAAADPNDWQSYQTMGDAYMKMDARAEALDAYQKSLQINPDNPDVKAQVDSLTASGVQAQAPAQQAPASNPSSPATGQFGESQPITETQTQTMVVERVRPRLRPRPAPVVYNDGLAPMDHAKFWTQVSLGYSYSKNDELVTSANSWNTDIANNGWTGSAYGTTDGLNLGVELGFLINPNSGLALGAKFINTADYTLRVNYQNQQTIGSTFYDSDFDNTTLSPYVIPFTLDYYLFMPDGGGRFWLSGGVGYYFGTVHVDRNYSDVIASYQSGDPNYANEFDHYTGDLTSGALGFQVGIGRDFALSRTLSLSLYARGRYARLTNFKGTITDDGGATAQVGLATEQGITQSDNNPAVFIEDQTQIGGNNNKYTTIDFTGFDVGLALNFYSL